jgi:NDP-sugar pyrophosphorylase family protein
MEKSTFGHGLVYTNWGRLKRLQSWLDTEETLLFTYGDVADLTSALLQFHQAYGKLAT